VRGSADRRQRLSVRSIFGHAHSGQGRHSARRPRPARTSTRHAGRDLADPALLKRLDIDSKKTYPVKQADLRNLAALVEASPAALSYRMKLIESRLAGKQKMALTASATAQAEHWKSVPGIGHTELWLMPYETIGGVATCPARCSRPIGRIHAVLRASRCAFGQRASAAY